MQHTILTEKWKEYPNQSSQINMKANLQKGEKKMAKCVIKEGADAVFLPGKIHGAEHEVYVIYMNWEANEGKGSFEIEIMDAERILKAFNESEGDADLFFEILPDMFQGEWCYCDAPSGSFDEYVEAYPTADFIAGRDGDANDEMIFLVRWAQTVQ